jgi:outer membrane protein assembly factor BamA
MRRILQLVLLLIPCVVALPPSYAAAPTVVAPSELVDSISVAQRRLPPSAPARLRLEAAFGICRDAGFVFASCAFDSVANVLHVRSGHRATVAERRFVGDAGPVRELFAQALGFNEGASWSDVRWRSALAHALGVVAESGYPFATASLRSIVSDPESGTVDLEIWFAPGVAAVVAGVLVRGATHTRPELLARLSGIRVGHRYRESTLAEAARRLESREIVEQVVSVEPESRSGDDVFIAIELRQPPHTGSFSGAIGVVRDPVNDEARVSGRIHLTMLDLLGSARQFRGEWLDDGATRSRLDLSYLEPLLLGSSLDLNLKVGQRHEDERYDTVFGEVGLRLPWAGRRSLAIHAAVDRSTFVGEQSRVRLRRRLGLEMGLRSPRGQGRGFYGAFESRISAAQLRESGASPPSQTLIAAHAEGGWALRPRVAIEGRADWESVETDELPLPASELIFLGGATSVRGYSEEQFRGESVAFGGAQLVIGASRRGQAYLFYDVGWARESRLVEQQLRESQIGLHGFGIGLRSPMAVGALDLSIGFAERFQFDGAKLHLSLSQDF